MADEEAAALIKAKETYDALETHFRGIVCSKIFTLVMCVKNYPLDETPHDREQMILRLLDDYKNGKLK